MSDSDFAPPATEAACHERIAEAKAGLVRVDLVLSRAPSGDPATDRLWRNQALLERAECQAELQFLKGWLRAHTAEVHERNRQQRAQRNADERAAHQERLARRAARKAARKALQGPDALAYNLYVALARRVGGEPTENEKVLLHTAQQYLAGLGVLGDD